MENRFKFRVWLNKLNRYSKNTDNLLLSEDGNVCEFDTVGCYSEKDVVIQQCTGIEDVKGNLIYEGDVLKIVNGSINGIGLSYKMEVKWVGDSWNIRQWSFDCTHFYEIIGNIYENKELLNGNKGTED